jgi:UDP-N-acetylglucosamine--N-acetylmuramyl-(pentapeptide) pyrophosphoryl-undecaprenol N-acetylglucosamine transferase
VETLPAVGLVRGNVLGFLKGFRESGRRARDLFEKRPPAAVLAMGGFTSAPPVLAGRRFRAATFLHESNAVPGRANRLLARFVSQAFVGFPSCARRLRQGEAIVSGTPVRRQFVRGSAEAARTSLGLSPGGETLLVMGGSQGASAINELLMRCAGDLHAELPDLQFLHVTGTKDCERVTAAYRQAGARAVVLPFLTEMELALNAATIAISRSGASSLAELAAMRVPPILIPYPSAADNHQFHNARALVETGAARMLGEERATPENLNRMVHELIANVGERRRLAAALAEWHRPNAAADIADEVVRSVPGWPRPARREELNEAVGIDEAGEERCSVLHAKP